MMNPTLKKVLFAFGMFSGAYGAYLMLKGEKPVRAVKKAITEPVKAVVNTADAITKPVTKHLVKGSKEAKEHMARLAKMPRKKKSKKKPAGHKGHKTKRGLSQDQKRKSKEDWEKAYQKKKVK